MLTTDGTGTDLYVANGIARWTAMGFPVRGLPDGEDVFARRTTSGAQIVPRRRLPPERIEELLGTPVVGYRTMVEDPYGVEGVRVPPGVSVHVYPTMLRPAGDVEVTAGDVRPVTVARELDEAERVIVEGFPRAELVPWSPGRMIPKSVLGEPGWTTWLARRDGEPAAAAVSYDDGAAVGVFWLATLPGHRGAGLGSAVMTSILAAHPGRASVLVATQAGLPLYERLGYRTVSRGHWYVRA
ncbi:GNAT family N-acetyltransferase [Kineosporia sp. J2-2]|uniref:GNAT family N-acetyltransferase n=1 Tax=Kineosporia corallincola TaxID=2835133 RepID=A0ABS5TIJ3_9ACTN|nr:GNAT family N-acetyltransferase [Kineosporia corallincola]MBT0770897.1 GNAT family N-acetyltransferase [Kineosporia corallincola]